MLSFYAPSRFVISETSSIEEEQELTIHTRDAHIFKLYKVTTRGGLERGETYVLLVFLFFLDRFSSLARSNLVPQLTDSHQRYALALKANCDIATLPYPAACAYYSSCCGRRTSTAVTASPTAGFETRLTRHLSVILI